MSIQKKKQLFDQFAQFITEHRKEKIEKVAEQRTRRVVVVLEDIHQSHNISAALRSCDCFGIQEVYVVEQRFRYVVNESISKGASGWLDIFKFKSTQDCFELLRKKGYKIIATSPHKNDSLISQIALDEPIALVFGNEETGLSEYALGHADGFVKIPMYGFTESFNISVAVSLCVYEITERLKRSSICWQLSEEAVVNLKLDWLMRTTYRHDQIQKLLEQ